MSSFSVIRISILKWTYYGNLQRRKMVVFYQDLKSKYFPMIRYDSHFDALLLYFITATDKIALLIGNFDYRSQQSLKAPQTDIQNLSNIFQNILGFKVSIFSLFSFRYSHLHRSLFWLNYQLLIFGLTWHDMT